MVLTSDMDPQRAKVAMDGLKWAAERMAPKQYGPKVQGTGQGGAISIVISDDDAGLV